MKDYILFYSKINNEIFFLFGIQNGHKKYSIIKYNYYNPFDDSSIVPLFNADFNHNLIDSQSLLAIIKSTSYPNFIKLNKDGLIYMIKINHIKDTKSYLKLNNNHYNLWTDLKWININNTQQLLYHINNIDFNLIKEFNLSNFIHNQYKIDLLKFNEKNFQLFNKLFRAKINRTNQNNYIKKNKYQYEQTLLKYFKNYQYNQMVAIYDYTTYSGDMNLLLRNILPPTNDFNKILITANTKTHINNAINIIKIINDAPSYSLFDTHYLSLYRGLSFDPIYHENQIIDIFKYSFVSTSSNIHVASNQFVPVNGALFKLIVPSNIPLIETRHVSHHSYEDEILLNPGHSFRVIKVDTWFNKDLKINQSYYTIALHNTDDNFDMLSKLSVYIN